MLVLTESDKARFWTRVSVRTRCQCWEWHGLVVKHYGQIQIGGKGRRAHRVAWAIWYGDPGDLLVCHKCDHPLCCNPTHLFLGTPKSNGEDCAIKGRRFNTKLTPDLVRQIRAECIPAHRDYGYSGLARKYGVNPGATWQAVNKTRWQHVT